MPIECGEVVVVGTEDNNKSHVELWTLSTHKMPIHQQYTDSSGVDSTHRIHKWSHELSVTLGWQGNEETIWKCLTIPSRS